MAKIRYEIPDGVGNFEVREVEDDEVAETEFMNYEAENDECFSDGYDGREDLMDVVEEDLEWLE